MKIHYIFVVFVLLACSCEDGLVDAANDAETETPQLLIQPRLLISANSNEKNHGSGGILATPAQSTEPVVNPCAHTMCPMIYCENNLPALPEQGICCQRCVSK